MTLQQAPAADFAAIPGSSGLPLVGHTYAFATGRLTATHHWYEKFGPISRVNAFGKTWVNVDGPDGCGAVLQDRDKAFDASGWSFLIGPFFRRGLMLLDGAEHHRHRRIMQEAFTAERLAGYLGPMNDDHRARHRAVAAVGLAALLPCRQATHPRRRHAHVHGRPRRAPRPSGSSTAFVDSVRAGTAFVRVAGPRVALVARPGRTPAARVVPAPAGRRPSGPATGTTCSARCATRRPRTARASPTTTSSTT